jgi:hypothetical protein
MVEQRVRHVVIVRRQLRFDSWNREEPANSNVEAIFDREVEVEILQNRIEAVLFVGLQELLAEVALRGREAIAGTKESIQEAQKVSSCFYFTLMRRSGKIRTVGCGSCKIQIRAFLKSGI